MAKTETTMTDAEVVSFKGRFLILHLKYEVKDNHCKRLIDIPCLEVPIYTEALPIIESQENKIAPVYVIMMNSDRARLCDDQNGNAMTETILETYPQEMTIEEIEKALGYSVKIVNEKDKKSLE